MKRNLSAMALSEGDSAERVAPRRPVFLSVGVSSSALGHARATVLNLSRLDAKIELACKLRRGEHVVITFPGLSPMCCRVAWSTGDKSGLTFLSALSSPVLNSLLENGRAGHESGLRRIY